MSKGAAVLILAAGASSRMQGADKLLERIDGTPLLLRQAKAAQAAAGQVLVALPPNRPARRAALAGIDVIQVIVTDANEGMGASIRAGVSSLPEGATGMAVLPADMPDISADDIETVLKAFSKTSDRIVRGASSDGRQGHPVVFPARLFQKLKTLKGDEGARSVLKNETPFLVPLPDEHALIDLDTPEDWASWRKERRIRNLPL